MITDRGLDLLMQIDDDDVHWQIAFDCMRSSNLFEQSLGYEVFTERFRSSIMPQLPSDTDVPVLLLEYLLGCISADISDEESLECDGYIHSKGDAFIELRVPLADYWGKYDCLLTEERYFQRIAKFVRSQTDVYHSELVTHTLEAFSPREKTFSRAMKAWKSEPVLSKYVADLEEVFDFSF